MAANLNKKSRATTSFCMQLLRGTDAQNHACFFYVVMPTSLAQNIERIDPANIPPEVIVHSGWGEPSSLDEHCAMEKLQQDFLKNTK